ncbi:MAG: PDZ domain-containing protein, partial [Candidatus Cybelea sp.]
MRLPLSRGLLGLVTLLVVIIYYMPIGHVDFAETWGEGTFGFYIAPRSTTIASVLRGSPGDRAGIRVGDTLVDGGDYAVSSRIRSPYPGERE